MLKMLSQGTLNLFKITLRNEDLQGNMQKHISINKVGKPENNRNKKIKSIPKNYWKKLDFKIIFKK